MYYLNPTTSRLSLLLHKSEAEPRTSVNNNDNVRVQWDLSGFHPIAFDVQDHGIKRSVPWKHISFLLGNGWRNSTKCYGTEKKMSEEPEKKQMKLSLKRKPLSPSSRFDETVTEDIIEQSSKGIIPSIIKARLRQLVRPFVLSLAFSDWITQRNKRNSEVFPSRERFV